MHVSDVERDGGYSLGFVFISSVYQGRVLMDHLVEEEPMDCDEEEIMENNQSQTGDFEARDYQLELLEKALERNTIISLKTGAGKTYIAVMLIKEKQAEMRKSYSQGGRRTFFLVPKVPLVYQQAKAIEDHTSLNVGRYHGEMNVDIWKLDEWNKELETHEVMVMTPQVLLDMLHKAYITLEKINLLIFDECHSATGEHPYCNIMARFKECSTKPHVLGLTASIISKKCGPEKIDPLMKYLEAVLHSSIETSSDVSSVNKHATKPRVIIVEVGPRSSKLEDITQDVMDLLQTGKQFMGSIREEFKKAAAARASATETECTIGDSADANGPLDSPPTPTLNGWEEDFEFSERMEFGCTPITMMKNVINIATSLGLFCTKLLCRIYLEDIPKHKQMAEDLFDECSAILFDVAAVILSEVEVTLAAAFKGTSDLDAAQHFVTPKVRRLLELLAASQSKLGACSGNSSSNSGIHSFRGIIFVELRIVAWMLAEYLQFLCDISSDQYGEFRPCYVVGHGTYANVERKTAMKVKKQWETLHRFRVGSFNLMVATQVVEEGLDVPKCNIVIRFDLPKVYSSYVQSMGRARSEKALFVLLVDADNMENFQDDIIIFKKIEAVLQSKSHDRDLPDEEMQEEFYDKHNCLPTYYTKGPDGPHVTMNSAIMTLHKYCNHLPHDRFTVLQPVYKWYRHVEKSDFLCSVILPSSSAVSQEITGIEMSKKSQAKKAAAFEACVRLHKAGELNDDLVPVDHFEQYQADLGIVPMEPTVQGESKPGTRKRQQLYDKKIAKDLLASFPKCGRNLYYVYAIIVKDDNSNENQMSFFGILSSKPITAINPFKLFGKFCYYVQLQLLQTCHGLNEDEVGRLEHFHQFLFGTALSTATSAMIYLPEEAQWSFLIIPLKGVSCQGMKESADTHSTVIDWALITSCEKYSHNQLIPKSFRKTTSFTEGDVLTTQYEDHNRRFYVIEVCRNLSPKSAFPKVGYVNYMEYFQSKYDVQVQDQHQPLLLVDYAPNALNMLSPQRSGPEVGKIKSNRLQHQIPELCLKFPLNIHQLRQALCIPSILHRLNGLLLAKEFKINIAKDTNQLPVMGAADLSTDLPQLESCSTKKGGPVDEVDSPRPVSLANTIDIDHINGCLYQALTTQSAANWSDLERLEFIGDSFLKYAVSVFLFSQYPNLNEGVLTSLRTGMIKNFTLYSHARDKEIPKMLNASMFQPRTAWLPPGYIIPGHLSEALITASIPAHLWPHACLEDCRNGLFKNEDLWCKQLTERWMKADVEQKDRAPKQTAPENAKHYNKYEQQLIGDKIVADSVEALIGAVLMCCGESPAVHFLNWLGLRVMPECFPWQCPTTALLPSVKHQLSPEMISSMYVDLDNLEQLLNYTFKDKSFLRQALVHPSYTRYPATDNYQRLEFLGDAVLDYLVTVTLHSMNSSLSPGKMTDLRSALVDNVTFAYLSVKRDMHKFIRYNSSMLYQVIDRYVKHIENFTHPKDAAYMITEDDTLVLEEIEVPKVLGDIFESIAGAVYVDSGYSLRRVWDVYYPIMKEVIEQYTVEVPISPVRMLLEKFPNATFSKPKKEDDIYIVETVCEGRKFVGCSKKKVPAKQAAAKCALNALRISTARRII